MVRQQALIVAVRGAELFSARLNVVLPAMRALLLCGPAGCSDLPVQSKAPRTVCLVQCSAFVSVFRWLAAANSALSAERTTVIRLNDSRVLLLQSFR